MPTPRIERLLSLAGLLLAWVFLVAVQLPIREVMPPDEPRYAVQAQTMKTTGDWVVPRDGDEILVEKPPLLFWSVGLASLPFDRVTETTARLPSALAALVVLLMTVRTGRRLWGSDTIAYGGALVTLTGIEFFQKAQWCSCDMVTAAFVWMAIVLWSEPAFCDPPPGHPVLRIALGWAAVALGILTKGPVTLVWVLFWLAAEGLASWKFPPLWRLVWNPGVLAASAIVGGWLGALGLRAGWPAVYEATVRQNVDRYVDAWNNVQAWWFYGVQTPGDLFPWALFLPAAIALSIRIRPAWGEEDSMVPGRTLALFSLFGLLFFSFSTGKRGVYVIEVFPAISLLIAAAVVRFGRGRLGLILMLVLGLVVGIGLPAAIASGVVRIPAALQAAGGLPGAAALVAGGLAIGAGAGAGLVFLRRRLNASALASAVAGTLVAFFLAGVVGGTTWSRMQRARSFSATMAAATPPDAHIAVEAAKYEQVMFYASRPTLHFKTDTGLADLLSSGQCRFAILLRSRYDRLRGTGPIEGLTVLAESAISGNDYVLVGPPKR
jgi:4-amino-4-deoxy-L-arabinose transferase-like glycosyltransferase